MLREARTEIVSTVPWSWLIRQFAQEIDAAYLAGDLSRAQFAQELLQRMASALQDSNTVYDRQGGL